MNAARAGVSEELSGRGERRVVGPGRAKRVARGGPEPGGALLRRGYGPGLPGRATARGSRRPRGPPPRPSTAHHAPRRDLLQQPVGEHRQQDLRTVGESRGDQHGARAAVVHPAGQCHRGAGPGVQPQGSRREAAQGEGQAAHGGGDGQRGRRQERARMPQERPEDAAGIDVCQQERAQQRRRHDRGEQSVARASGQRRPDQQAEDARKHHRGQREGLPGHGGGGRQAARGGAAQQRAQHGHGQWHGERARQGGGEDETDGRGLVALPLRGPHRRPGRHRYGDDQDHRGDHAAAAVLVGGTVQHERHAGHDQQRRQHVQRRPGEQRGRAAQQQAQLPQRDLEARAEQHQGQQQLRHAEPQFSESGEADRVRAAQPQPRCGRQRGSGVHRGHGTAEPVPEQAVEPGHGRGREVRAHAGSALPSSGPVGDGGHISRRCTPGRARGRPGGTEGGFHVTVRSSSAPLS